MVLIIASNLIPIVCILPRFLWRRVLGHLFHIEWFTFVSRGSRIKRDESAELMPWTKKVWWLPNQNTSIFHPICVMRQFLGLICESWFLCYPDCRADGAILFFLWDIVMLIVPRLSLYSSYISNVSYYNWSLINKVYLIILSLHQWLYKSVQLDFCISMWTELLKYYVSLLSFSFSLSLNYFYLFYFNLNMVLEPFRSCGLVWLRLDNTLVDLAQPSLGLVQSSLI